MAGETPAVLAWEFRQFANQNQRVKKPVLHLSFSPAPGDRTLDEWELCQIASYLLDGLKLSNNQFILVQHNDTEFDGQLRPHAHMVINRVAYNGDCNDDYLDYYRTEKILRQIEKEYNLIVQPSSWEVEKKKAYPRHIPDNSVSEPNIVERLQLAIEKAAADFPEMPVFVARLLKENIQVDCKFTRTGKLKGISYCLDGQPFKGGDLGKLYTHIGIREHLKVGYQEEYQNPIDSLIVSFKRGRKIDDRWVNHLENLYYDDDKQDSDSDRDNSLTTSELNTPDNSHQTTLPPAVLVTTQSNKPLTKKQSKVLSQPPSPIIETAALLEQPESIESIPVVPVPPPDNIDSTSAIPVEQPQNIESIPAVPIPPPDNIDSIPAIPVEQSQNIGSIPAVPVPLPESIESIPVVPIPSPSNIDSIPVTPVEQPENIESIPAAPEQSKQPDQMEDNQQQQYAEVIATTVRMFWSNQKPDRVLRGSHYDLELENSTIKIKRKSGEEIALIPLSPDQQPSGIALHLEDLKKFHQLQQLLLSNQAKQQQQQQKRSRDSGLEF
jgi:Relaxase/Mobilisation nuclease domain